MKLQHSIAAFVAAVLLTASAGSAQAQTAADLFDAQTLQEVRLFINSRDLLQLRENFQENTYYTADFQWRNIRVRNIGLRSRGVASRSGVKLALRIDFDRYTTGQQFLGLQSVILKNLWQDGSMMHEQLAMALFTRMGQPASREAFCRLFINNEYQGLYSIVESVDTDFLDRTLGESAGYLFSYQFQQPFHAEDPGDDLDVYKRMFEPQTHEREADSVLYVPIRELFREINQPDDAVWRERVERYVDLWQFVTQIALENFLAEEDGLLGFNGLNNFYLYRMAETTRHRFIPWDKDSTFFSPGFTIMSRVDENVLSRKALAFPDLRELYIQTLEAAARSASEDSWLENEIGRIANLVAVAVEQDTRKPFSTEAFFESVESLKDFARRRPAFVTEEVAAARRGQ
jgi:spore coat protein CotH